MSAPNPPGYYEAVPSTPGYQPGPSKMDPPPPQQQQQQQQQQQPGYYPAQPPPQQGQSSNTTVILNQPQTVRCVRFGANPVEFQCPYCNNRVTTYLQYTPGVLAWLIVALLCLLGFFICFFIPLVVDSVKDVEHYCPVCNNKVGSYQRLS